MGVPHVKPSFIGVITYNPDIRGLKTFIFQYFSWFWGPRIVNDGILMSWGYEIIPYINWVGNFIVFHPRHITLAQPGALFFLAHMEMFPRIF